MAQREAEGQTQRVQVGAAAVIGLCFLIAVLEGFDIQIMGVAAPKLAPALRLTTNELGLAFAASNLGLVIGASGGGWLVDRIARKRMFAAAVALLGLFTLAAALARNFPTLFAMRLIAGIGLGAAMPTMTALAADVSPPGRRASVAAMVFCGMPLGGAAVAFFVSRLPPDFDWRAIFVVGGAPPLLMAGVILAVLRETRPAFAGAAAAERGDIGAALFGGGRLAPTLLIWAMFLPTLLILHLMLNWLPTLAAAKGLTKADAAQAALAFNLASVAGALALGWAVDRFGLRWISAAAYFGLIATMIALAAARARLEILGFSAAAGFCLTGALCALYGPMTTFYPAAHRGVGSGFAISAGRIGSIMGPLAAALLLSAGQGAAQVLAAMAPAAAASGISAFALSFFKRAEA